MQGIVRMQVTIETDEDIKHRRHVDPDVPEDEGCDETCVWRDVQP